MTDPPTPRDEFGRIFEQLLTGATPEPAAAEPPPLPGPRAPAPNYNQGGSANGTPPAPDPAQAFAGAIQDFARHRSPTGMWLDLFDQHTAGI